MLQDGTRNDLESDDDYDNERILKLDALQKQDLVALKIKMDIYLNGRQYLHRAASNALLRRLIYDDHPASMIEFIPVVELLSTRHTICCATSCGERNGQLIDAQCWE